MITPALFDRAMRLVESCRAAHVMVTTAESCTGGLVAALLTDIPNSSAMFDRGLVTYSNAAKRDLLGVPAAVLDNAGAVSAACARAMASGALERAPAATLAVAVTGIAGPAGGTADKPVGLVHFGCVRRGCEPVHVERRFGDIGRSAVRIAAVGQALALLEDALAQEPLKRG